MRRVSVKEHLWCSTLCMVSLREADYVKRNIFITLVAYSQTAVVQNFIIWLKYHITAIECNKNSCFQVFTSSKECIRVKKMQCPSSSLCKWSFLVFLPLILECKTPSGCSLSAQRCSVLAYSSVGMLCSRMIYCLITQINMRINDLHITACCFSTDRSDEQFSWDSRVPSALRTRVSSCK